MIVTKSVSFFVVFMILSNFCFNIAQAQLPSESDQPILPLGRGPLPNQQLFPPVRSVADIAQEYWITNNCVYPPRTFYAMFREACDVRGKAGTFLSGICQAFFNSSKAICTLEGASADDKQTLLSIADLQSTIGDDELCDTIAEMKSSEPNIFPSLGNEEELPKWFEEISNVIFTPDTCSSECSANNAHPICFGYMLNYNYISSLKSDTPENKNDETAKEASEDLLALDSDSEQENNEAKEEARNKNKKPKANDTLNKVFDYYSDTSDTFQPEVNSSFPFRPNPKLLSSKLPDSEQYYYGFDDDMNLGTDENSDELGKNSDYLNDYNDSDDHLVDEKTMSDNDDNYSLDSEISLEELPSVAKDLLKKIAEKESVDEARFFPKSRLRSHSVSKMDRSDEIPLLSLLLAFSSILALMTLFILVRARKKIGSYIRHIRQRRRTTNWSYERVLTGQVDDNE